MRDHRDHCADSTRNSSQDVNDSAGTVPDDETTNSSARSAGDSSRSAQQRLLTGRAVHEADLSIPDVWLRYFSFSGMVEEYEVHAYLQGLIDLPRLQRDLIAQAVNELIDELPAPPRAPADADLDTDPTDPEG